MKIALCTHQLPRDEPGGVGAFTVNLAAELACAGHEVTLIAGSSLRPRAPAPDANVLDRQGSCWIEEAESCSPGVRTLRLLRASTSHTALGRFVDSFTHRHAEAVLLRALRQTAPDVLHVQHTLNLSARLSSIGKAAGCAVVATVHDFWPICQRIDLRRPDGRPCPGPAGGLRCAACLPSTRAARTLNLWDGWQQLRRRGEHLAELGLRAAPYLLRTQLVQGGYALADRVTCPAPFVAELLQQAGFDGDRIAVVDYGIPPLSLEVLRQPRPRTPLRFGFLGTLGAHKGPWVMLHAAQILAEESDHRFRLAIHGGPLRDSLLRERLHDLAERSAGRVEYRGPYPTKRLPEILAGIDVLVIPSLWRETGPMVWMEAIAAGLPVVASCIGALAGRVRDGEDGLLVPPGDAAALAGAMGQSITRYDELRRGAMGRGVRSVSQAAGELLLVYREAIAVHRGGRAEQTVEVARAARGPRPTWSMFGKR